MRTFNFVDCSVCENLKSRKEDILSYKFDSNITNNIVSFLGCNSCRRMKTYEDIYSDKKFDNLSKIQKQIHCLFSFFDNDYKKLKNLRDKKKYLKELIDRSNCHIKPLVKKFLSNSVNIYSIDLYIKFFLENNIEEALYFIDGHMEEITFRTRYSEPLGYVFRVFFVCYLDHLIGWCRKQYFNDIAISFYIMNN